MKVLYDMLCDTCDHTASDHWWSSSGKPISGSCHVCISSPIVYGCKEFKGGNLSYLECLANRRKCA